MITIEDFEKVEMRVGRIVAVEDFPKAHKPAYKLTIDFGPFGERRSSAQITKLYTKEQLLGMQVVAVTNFPARRIADFQSDVLVLGVVQGEGEVVLLTTERETELGRKIS